CVAGLAALDLLTDEQMARNRRLGEGLRAGLREALGGSPLLKEVRGAGLIAGLALHSPDHPWLSFEHMGLQELGGHPSIGFYLCHRLYKRGFYCFVCGHEWGTLRVQPRYDIPEERLAAFVRAVSEELEYLCEL